MLILRTSGLAFLTTAFLLSGCEQSKPVAAPLTPVRVQSVEALDSGQGLRYSASIAPKTQIDVEFKVSGYVDYVLEIAGAAGLQIVQPGDRVAKNTVLARIREQEFQDKLDKANADLARANAALTKGTADFDRAKALYATQSITAPDYDKARKEFETAQASVAAASAQVDEAKLNLSYTALPAPLDGVVLQRNIEVGSLIHLGNEAFVMADVSTVKAIFGVPDAVLKQLSIGDRMSITTESIPGTKFDGQITTIAPAADEKTRLFSIELSLPNPDDRLRIGMIASLQVPASMVLEQPPLVPLDAIISAGESKDDYAVFTIDESAGKSIARLQRVRLGGVYGNKVAVNDGIKTGEKVVVMGASLITDNEAVSVLP